MSYETEKARLEQITPKSLPGNAAESGLGADLIQEKFYKGIFYLHDLLELARQAYASADSALAADIAELDASLVSLASRVSTLEVEVLRLDVLDGQILALQTLTATHSDNITAIQSAIATITANIAILRSDIINGTISAYKAIRDGDGNIIKTTYATKSELTAANSEITKIKNGETIVDKARKDQNGDAIDLTYTKKSQIVDSLVSTATNQPLSANQGKALKALIDALSSLVQSNDVDLDTVQEIVNYIKSNKSLIESITTSKVSVSDIIDNVTSEIANKPLSAKQGYVLKGLIDSLTSVVGTKADAVDVYTKTEIDTNIYTKTGADNQFRTEEQVSSAISSQLAGVETMNVIADEYESVNYTFQIKIQDGKAHLLATPVEV